MLSSIMRRTFPTGTTSPRDGRTGMPFFIRCFEVPTFDFAGVGACKARRKNSDRIFPAVFLSLAARSFAAESTSSSISRVVRMMRDDVASDAFRQAECARCEEGRVDSRIPLPFAASTHRRRCASRRGGLRGAIAGGHSCVPKFHFGQEWRSLRDSNPQPPP